MSRAREIVVAGDLADPGARIVRAVPADFSYIQHLQRLHSNNVGFVPNAAIQNHLDRGNYRLLIINDQPAGYSLAGGGTRTPFRISQVALDEEQWRNGYGTRLIELALSDARQRPKPHAVLSARDATPMSVWIPATGASVLRVDRHKTARGRPLITYQWHNPTDTSSPQVLGFAEPSSGSNGSLEPGKNREPPFTAQHRTT